MANEPVIVITRTPSCPATLALTMEGVEVTECIMRVSDYVQYGRTFTEQWQSRKGFIVVEEDIIPWPGAIRQLQMCDHEWCCFLFPNGHVIWDDYYNTIQSGLCDGLGCMKFSDSLVNSIDFGYEWQNKGWDELDGAVHGILRSAGVELHIHNPPVAHSKAITTTMKRSQVPIN